MVLGGHERAVAAPRTADGAEALARDRYASTVDGLWLRGVIGSCVLAALLAAAIPKHGWLPFLVLAVTSLIGSARHRRDELPERFYAVSHLCWLVAMGVIAAFDGGAHSFLLPLIGALSLAFFARLRPSVAIAYASASFVLSCIPVLVVDWNGFVRDPWLLLSCLVGTVSMGAIASQMAAGEMHHRADATIDQLTGLLNRRGLQHRLAELTDQALVLGDDTPLALVACDLDHFKLVNDTFGHPRGDDVLRDVAYIIRKQLRRFELAYRMGGEEFLIVLPGHDLMSATAVAEGIRAAVENGRPGGVSVTISLGVAVARAADADVEELQQAADDAVYSAKRNGRNQVGFAAGAYAPPIAPAAA